MERTQAHLLKYWTYVQFWVTFPLLYFSISCIWWPVCWKRIALMHISPGALTFKMAPLSHVTTCGGRTLKWPRITVDMTPECRHAIYRVQRCGTSISHSLSHSRPCTNTHTCDSLWHPSEHMSMNLFQPCQLIIIFIPIIACTPLCLFRNIRDRESTPTYRHTYLYNCTHTHTHTCSEI